MVCLSVGGLFVWCSLFAVVCVMWVVGGGYGRVVLWCSCGCVPSVVGVGRWVCLLLVFVVLCYVCGFRLCFGVCSYGCGLFRLLGF